METSEKFADAKKILKYWYTMEFLDQAPIISQEDIKKQKTLPIVTLDGKKGEMAADELYKRFGTWDFGDIDYYVGSFYREDLLKRLAVYFGVNDPRVEHTPKDDYAKMAFFLVQTDQKGHYVSHSFQLSPLLWALKTLNDHKGDSDALLDLDDYEDTVKKWDEEFQALESENNDRGLENNPMFKMISAHGAVLDPDDPWTGLTIFQGYLVMLYVKLYQEYLLPAFKGNPHYPENPEGMEIILHCPSYTQGGKKKEDTEVQLPMISDSFFVDDLKMLFDAITKHPDEFTGTPMGQVLLDYINDPKLTEEDLGKRVDVNALPDMAPDKKEAYERFMATVLDTKYAPLGRWPTQYPPALMQQVAINMVSQMTGKYKDSYFGANGPIFSVNGPPGTGKTTLLKEIIVNNIVERARLLANYEKADDAFEKKQFKHGTAVMPGGAAYADHRYSSAVPGYYTFKDDRINNYGMLVASCNNKAVENITTDIPVDGEVSAFIKAKRGEAPFIQMDMDDFYFTGYARKMLDDPEAWGLVAAPLGKGANLNKFFRYVEDPLVKKDLKKDNISGHAGSYTIVRGLFLDQYRKVETMRQQLSEVSHLALGELPPGKKPAPPAAPPHASSSGTQEKPTGLGGIFKRFGFGHRTQSAPAVRSPGPVEVPAPEKQEVPVYSEKELWHKAKTLMEEEKTAYGEDYGALFEKYVPLDLPFLERLFSRDEKEVTKQQTSDPGFSHNYDQERKKLFLLAMLLHKEFILSSKYFKYNMENFRMLKKGELPYPEKGKKPFANKDTEYREDYEAAMGPVLQSLFLLTPVVSTTFASVQRFLDGVDTGTIGLLIVDESGQASPQMALGAMYRSRAAVIVGDPKQVEPVVTDELDLLKKSYEKDRLYVPYTQKGNSVQTFADKLNHFGTYLKDPGGDGPGTWVGSPLVVHRRCISPMYDISNTLSYNGIMKKASIEPSERKKKLFWQPKSLWLNVKGSERGSKNHFVEKQAEYIFHILQISFANYGAEGKEPDIFIISPFKTVAGGMKSYILRHKNELGVDGWDAKKLNDWMGTHIGTVHTFQGQGAQEVIFFPGCCDTTKDGTLQFVNANIVNVAVTRAKSRLYVVGDWDTWSRNPFFRIMQNVMSNCPETTELCMTPEACAEKVGMLVQELMEKPAEKPQEQPMDVPVADAEASRDKEGSSTSLAGGIVPPPAAGTAKDAAAKGQDSREIHKQTVPVWSGSIEKPDSHPAGERKTMTESNEKHVTEIRCPKCHTGTMKRILSKHQRYYWKCFSCGAYGFEKGGHLNLADVKEDTRSKIWQAPDFTPEPAAGEPANVPGFRPEESVAYPSFRPASYPQETVSSPTGSNTVEKDIPCVVCQKGKMVPHTSKRGILYWKCDVCGAFTYERNGKPDMAHVRADKNAQTRKDTRFQPAPFTVEGVSGFGEGTGQPSGMYAQPPSTVTQPAVGPVPSERPYPATDIERKGLGPVCTLCGKGNMVFHKARKSGGDNYWKCGVCGAFAYDRDGKPDMLNIFPDRPSARQVDSGMEQVPARQESGDFGRISGRQDGTLDCPVCGNGKMLFHKAKKSGGVNYWKCNSCGAFVYEHDGKPDMANIIPEKPPAGEAAAAKRESPAIRGDSHWGGRPTGPMDEPICPLCHRGKVVFHKTKKANGRDYWKCDACGAFVYDNGKGNGPDMTHIRPDTKAGKPGPQQNAGNGRNRQPGAYTGTRPYVSRESKPGTRPLCGHCGTGKLVRKMGKWRPYWQCSNPHCGYMYGDTNGKVNYKEEVVPQKRK